MRSYQEFLSNDQNTVQGRERPDESEAHASCQRQVHDLNIDICPKPNLSIFCRLVGVLLISLLRSQIQAAITSLLSSALGRSIPANKVAKVALRQGLLGNLASNGGLLGGLTNNAAEQPANIMEDMAMNVSMPIFLFYYCPTYCLR